MRALIAIVRSARVAVLALGLFLCACSPKQAPATPAPQASAKMAKANPEEDPFASNVPAPKSVFQVNSSSRDPFFPKSKRSAAPVVEASTRAPEVALDVPSLMQTHFQGVISSAGQRIAVINNVMLEPGRSAVIPIRAGGSTKEFSVRCREIEKDSVVIEVQGYGQPIRVSRPAQ